MRITFTQWKGRPIWHADVSTVAEEALVEAILRVPEAVVTAGLADVDGLDLIPVVVAPRRCASKSWVVSPKPAKGLYKALDYLGLGYRE